MRHRVSLEWMHMDSLSAVLPANIAVLNSNTRLFANAVYSQFTSGIAPSWFTQLPPDTQSYVVRDFLPNNLDQPMSLDLLALASPAAKPTLRPTATATPESTVSVIRSPSAIVSPSAVSDHRDHRKLAIVLGVILPITMVALLTSLTVLFIKRREARKVSRAITNANYHDKEKAVRGCAAEMPDIEASPTTDIVRPSQRTLSEGDLRGSFTPSKAIAELDITKSAEECVELEAAVSPQSANTLSPSTASRSTCV